MIERIRSELAELESNRWYEFGLLAAVTMLAAVLRFYKLGAWSFWIDELFTIGHVQAHYDNLESIVRNIPPATNWIPVSLILTGRVLNLLRVSEWSARLVSAVIGVISIPALYFPVKRLFSSGVGLVAMLLLAVSPWHLYWSQNARFYTALMLLYTLALFAFLLGVERDRPGYILLFPVLLYLAASERLLALFAVPVVVGYLLLLVILRFEKPPGLRARNLLFMVLPWIGFGIIEIRSVITSGYPRFFGGLEWFFQYQVDDPLRLFTFISFNLGVPVMCFGFFSGVYLLLQRSRPGLLLFLGALIPLAVLLLLNPFVFTKDRYAFVTLPSWILLSAVGIKEVFSRARGSGRIVAIGILAVLLADATGSNLLYYQVNNGNRRDWEGAFALIKERSRESDRFVAYWPELGNYYLGEEVMSWKDIDPDAVMETGERFWFVTDSETVWANSKMKRWVEEKAQLIDVFYLRTPDDFSLRIYLYDPAGNTASGEPR